MPPPVSDLEDDSMSDIDAPESIPAKATKGKAKPAEEPEEDEGDEEEEAEDEYLVEKIMEHGFGKNGTVKYRVKWLGYEDEADMTWEPVENLETAPDKLEEYHDSIGGPPTREASAKKGKKRGSTAVDSPAPPSTKKRTRKSDANGATDDSKTELVLPKGSWENDVSHVMSIVEEDQPDPKKPSKQIKVLMGFLQWNDMRKSKHPLKTLRTKCPQALLTYYERHLVFSKSEDVADDLKTTD